jgi:hypothetical protein
MKMIEIFYPCVALVFLTQLVLFLVAISRKIALNKKDVSWKHFKTYLSGSPTDFMAQTKNNLSNLFETPLHFYLICIILYVTKTTDPTFLLLAWIYVGLRFFHSLIHLTSNYVPMRFLFFLLSIITLNLIWIRWLTTIL